MGHTDEEPHHASMLTLKVAVEVLEEESDDADQGIQSYNDMLAEMGYAPGHHDGDTKEGGTIYYNGHAKTDTARMNTNAAASKPNDHANDCVGENEDAEKEPVGVD